MIIDSYKHLQSKEMLWHHFTGAETRGCLQYCPNRGSLTPSASNRTSLMSQSKSFPLSQAALNMNSLLQNFGCKNFFQTSVELVLTRTPWSSYTRLCSKNFSARERLGSLPDEMPRPGGTRKVHFHIGNITGFLFKTFSDASCPHCNSPTFSNEEVTSVKDVRHIETGPHSLTLLLEEPISAENCNLPSKLSQKWSLVRARRMLNTFTKYFLNYIFSLLTLASEFQERNISCIDQSPHFIGGLFC